MPPLQLTIPLVMCMYLSNTKSTPEPKKINPPTDEQETIPSSFQMREPDPVLASPMRKVDVVPSCYQMREPVMARLVPREDAMSCLVLRVEYDLDSDVAPVETSDFVNMETLGRRKGSYKKQPSRKLHKFEYNVVGDLKKASTYPR